MKYTQNEKILQVTEKTCLCQEFVGKFSNNSTSPLFINLVGEIINIIPYLAIVDYTQKATAPHTGRPLSKKL
ncbi:hypothetical protein [Caldanaerobius polysaccharolyticus]|uniref:hypothetical protein n=1 Tax=Caldanaerobius polysaccharolyticus TaxID=44256 RepID=UPI00047E8E66|nr:hypothetical protein [Caldanaerobius polysaccharolyticus]